MSSKAAEITGGSPSASTTSLSMTKRLSALNILAALTLLVTASLFFMWAVEKEWEEEDRELLNQKVQVIRDLLSNNSIQSAALGSEIRWDSLSDTHIKFYTRIFDESGNLLIETPGMADILDRKAFPSPSGTDELTAKIVRLKSPDGRHAYRLVAARVATGTYKQPLILQLGLDISGEITHTARHGKMVVILIMLGIVLATLVGYAITRRGLRPLREVTEAIQRVTPSHLDERINQVKWPSELSALAEVFNRSISGLEDAFGRLSRYASDLAHELRTPINNLMGETEVVLSKSRTADEYRQVLESSLEEYGKLSRLIDGLLFLARADNPKTTIQKSLLDASREIEAIREFYDILAEDNGITVICEGSALLKADQILFQRAVSNLVSNALQYTSRGGTVTISVREAVDRCVEVSVQDTGIGISSEDLPKIFDRFYRASSGRSRHPEGTGLGLPIVKSIMDLHGGTVYVQSESGKGTTATLRFPSPA
jgi:two-component system, OmpR family, heavy metal sensor histidine kinase CusS